MTASSSPTTNTQPPNQWSWIERCHIHSLMLFLTASTRINSDSTYRHHIKSTIEIKMIICRRNQLLTRRGIASTPQRIYWYSLLHINIYLMCVWNRFVPFRCSCEAWCMFSPPRAIKRLAHTLRHSSMTLPLLRVWLLFFYKQHEIALAVVTLSGS